VLGLSRSPEAPSAYLAYRWGAPVNSSDLERFTFAALDLNHDAEAIAHRLRDFQPRVVINFAAQSMVAESWQHPEQWYETNVVSNVRLHEALRALGSLQRYVHVSTPEVYGSTNGRVPEHTHYNPSTPYAASRAACDLHLMTCFHRYGFPVVFTRAPNVYGPGQQLYRIIPKTIVAIRRSLRLPLHGGGRSIRSFIHIRDVAEATIRIAVEAQPPAVFHLATDEMISIRDLVRMTCEEMGADFDALVDNTEDRPGKDAVYCLDWKRAREELNWRPAVTLREGIRETIAWVNRYWDFLRSAPLEYVHRP
jgi:dTDP-glucose 4,6-dehydratase